MRYDKLFHSMHQGFFEKDDIRDLPDEFVFSEQLLDLKGFSADAVSIKCPENITFGFAQNAHDQIVEAVGQVDEDWVQYFEEDSLVFCAFDGERIVSFCILDDMGWHEGLHISGPGCVGTIPAYRGQGIGLRMVQLATEYLQQNGFHASYIHYTHIDHWYAKLGYETILKWNRNGILWTKDEQGTL